MIVLLTVCSALGATPPILPLVFDWRRDKSSLLIGTTGGFEISPEAPVDLRIQSPALTREFHANGALVLGGVPLGEIRGQELTGTIDLQLCEKSSGLCSPASYSFTASISTAKKSVAQVMAQAVKNTEPSHKELFNRDASADVERAFTKAKASGDRVLLDFSAVWCPPCNALAAEVLHAEDADDTLSGLQVVVIDVDHPSSWALKSTYNVGGYPTVIITDGDGKELGKMVGFPGRDPFLDFVHSSHTPSTDWQALDPATLRPDKAAEGFLAMLDIDGADLDAWAKAAAPSDIPAAHIARFRHQPSAEEVRWLTEHVPEQTLEWLPSMGEWGGTEGRHVLRDALPQTLNAVDPVVAADILWFAAQLEEGSAKRLTYAAAAATLRGTFTGDFEHDRSNYTYLATLEAKSGDLTHAVQFMDELTKAHPEEPTFLLEAASLLNEHEHYDEALQRAKLAAKRSWGDNALRVALAQCEALVGLDRAQDAAVLAEQILASQPAPAATLKVRTHRYRDQLKKFLKP